MLFTDALSKQSELVDNVGLKLAHLNMGVGLFLEEANLVALAADGITEGRDDRKIDFMINNEEAGRLIFAQGFHSTSLKAPDKAPAGKASDLNTAAAWLVSGDDSKLPPKLRQKILALLWHKYDFWDSQDGISLIHEEPALMEAGDGRGLARRSGGLAGAISGGIAAQDPNAGVSGLYRRSDRPR